MRAGRYSCLLLLVGKRAYREVEVRKQVVVRVQRRVRMGMKDELGLPYIYYPHPGSHDYLLVFIWSPTFPYSFFLGLSGAA